MLGRPTEERWLSRKAEDGESLSSSAARNFFAARASRVVPPSRVASLYRGWANERNGVLPRDSNGTRKPQTSVSATFSSLRRASCVGRFERQTRRFAKVDSQVCRYEGSLE